jgi:hypothetical protein
VPSGFAPTGRNGLKVAEKPDQNPPEGHRLTAAEVGARVGAILGDAEREAREIIASARGEATPGAGATIEDLAHALERLSARFDAFELSTAAAIEDLGRQLREAVAGAGAQPASQMPQAPSPRPPRQESPACAAARLRAVDLALAGYSRERIANELAVSLPRGEVDALLDEVLDG